MRQSQIVAAETVDQQIYKTVPTKAWERYRYVICANCKVITGLEQSF